MLLGSAAIIGGAWGFGTKVAAMPIMVVVAITSIYSKASSSGGFGYSTSRRKVGCVFGVN